MSQWQIIGGSEDDPTRYPPLATLHYMPICQISNRLWPLGHGADARLGAIVRL